MLDVGMNPGNNPEIYDCCEDSMMLGEAQIWVNQKPSSFADMASRIGLPPAFVPYRQCAGLRCGTHIHNNNAEVIGQPLVSYIWEMKPSPRFKIPRHKRAPAEAAAISPRQTGLPDLHPLEMLSGELLSSRGPKPIPLHGTNRLLLGQSMCGLAWTYMAHTPADEDLLKAGVILCQTASTPVGLKQPPSDGSSCKDHEDVPLILSNEGSAGTPYVFHSNGKIIAIPSRFPEPDMRFIVAGPDYQGEVKLPEYQVIEMLGRRVWRHDRDLLICSYPACGLLVSDYNPNTIVCLSCGPKTTVRYCQLAHQIADIDRHYKECSSASVLIRLPIDNSTTPARFRALCPAIRSIIPGSKSVFYYRQRLYSMYFGGVYTLFGFNGEERPILWPEDNPEYDRALQMTERLLSYAFYNHRNEQVMAHLFRLLQKALDLRGDWSRISRNRLVTQWKQEWDISLKRSDDDDLLAKNIELYSNPAYNLPLCGCDWFGDELPPSQHIPLCPFGKGSKAPLSFLRSVGEVISPARGIKHQVELAEAKNWSLRAWRQRHPEVKSWMKRAEGEGFRGVRMPERWKARGGEGWSGWGMDAENQCEGLRDRRKDGGYKHWAAGIGI